MTGLDLTTEELEGMQEVAMQNNHLDEIASAIDEVENYLANGGLLN